MHAEKCPVCEGSGEYKEKECHGCNGKGWIEVSDNNYSFKFPEIPEIPDIPYVPIVPYVPYEPWSSPNIPCSPWYTDHITQTETGIELPKEGK